MPCRLRAAWLFSEGRKASGGKIIGCDLWFLPGRPHTHLNTSLPDNYVEFFERHQGGEKAILVHLDSNIGRQNHARKSGARGTSVRTFRDYDEKLLKRQQAFYHDEESLIASNKEAMKDLEELFDSDEKALRKQMAEAEGEL